MSERFKLIPAVYLLLREDDNVLLLHRFNTGYQDGKYSLIAGHLDGDELASKAMVREAKEEAGIVVDISDLKLVHTAHRLSRGDAGQERVDLFFETHKWTGKITNKEPNKCDDLSWFSINAIPTNVIPFVGSVLAAIQKGDPYSEYTTEP